MTVEQFWALIDRARTRAEGDGEGTGEILAEMLGSKSQKAIRAFAAHLNDCLARSHTTAMEEACTIMLGGGGDDAFEYFRAWLVTRGRDVFEAAIADPDTLADIDVADAVEECGSESLLTAAEQALEEAGGEGVELVVLDIERGQPAFREATLHRLRKRYASGDYKLD